MDYRVDLRDVKFQLLEWLPIAKLLDAEAFADWDAENLEMVLDEALKIAQEQMAPGNEDGDREGARWDDGVVTVPESFKSAYRTIAEGGWIGCTNNPEFGGLGLPHVAGTVVTEFFAGANMSLTLVLVLTRGTGSLIERHGTEEMKAQFCEKLYTGEWTGTMCLTEPQAGSDVGASVARALPQDDGSYLISGEKIFITFGDHDLTDNVVHAVLARVPGAPSGTRGLSLFAVPKYRVAADGGSGEPNDVRCASIEHKLGIHGSPTCSILFGPEGACQGFLLGEENRGMRLMFEMMNAARIEVGLQGAAVAGAAHQAALAYARERIQARHWSKARDREALPVAIVEHPDVRRLLLTSSAYVEAMRAMLLQTSFFLDLAHASSDEAERNRYQSYVEVMTPICKAWASDWGFRVTEWCLQVFGGYGYVKEYPAEQYLRDSKIASIYEGTNGIQALDLVGRKLAAGGGQPFRELLGMAAETAGKVAGDPLLGEPGKLLGGALAEIQEVAAAITTSEKGPLLMMLNAVPFLDMVGNTLAAHYLLDQAHLAGKRLATILEARGITDQDADAYSEFVAEDREAAFFHNKRLTASHFAYRVLPQVGALGVALRSGETAPIDAVM